MYILFSKDLLKTEAALNYKNSYFNFTFSIYMLTLRQLIENSILVLFILLFTSVKFMLITQLQ